VDEKKVIPIRQGSLFETSKPKTFDIAATADLPSTERFQQQQPTTGSRRRAGTSHDSHHQGARVNVSFGLKEDLGASVNARQVVEKLPPVN
jgi:hypothetical protein